MNKEVKEMNEHLMIEAEKFMLNLGRDEADQIPYTELDKVDVPNPKPERPNKLLAHRAFSFILDQGVYTGLNCSGDHPEELGRWKIYGDDEPEVFIRLTDDELVEFAKSQGWEPESLDDATRGMSRGEG